MGSFYENTGLTQDFSGPETRARIKRLLDQAVESFGLKQIEVLWATGAATIAAMFLSKDVPWFSKLIIGNGIFEIDGLNVNITPYKEALQAARSKSDKPAKGDESSNSKDDFTETRSIAWDASGIPKNVVIYHSKNNTLSSADSAKSFRDSLASEQLQVKFVPLEGTDQAIDEKIHFSLLKALLSEK
jgi:hypothetical protein